MWSYDPEQHPEKNGAGGAGGQYWLYDIRLLGYDGEYGKTNVKLGNYDAKLGNYYSKYGKTDIKYGNTDTKYGKTDINYD